MEANEKYTEQYRKIQNELSTLNEKLKNHKGSFEKETNIWGYPGDLGYVLFQLEQINSFLTEDH